MTPAFHIHLGKVDETHPRRVPPNLPSRKTAVATPLTVEKTEPRNDSTAQRPEQTNVVSAGTQKDREKVLEYDFDSLSLER